MPEQDPNPDRILTPEEVKSLIPVTPAAKAAPKPAAKTTPAPKAASTAVSGGTPSAAKGTSEGQAVALPAPATEASTSAVRTAPVGRAAIPVEQPPIRIEQAPAPVQEQAVNLPAEEEAPRVEARHSEYKAVELPKPPAEKDIAEESKAVTTKAGSKGNTQTLPQPAVRVQKKEEPVSEAPAVAVQPKPQLPLAPAVAGLTTPRQKKWIKVGGKMVLVDA